MTLQRNPQTLAKVGFGANCDTNAWNISCLMVVKCCSLKVTVFLSRQGCSWMMNEAIPVSERFSSTCNSRWCQQEFRVTSIRPVKPDPARYRELPGLSASSALALEAAFKLMEYTWSGNSANASYLDAHSRWEICSLNHRDQGAGPKSSATWTGNWEECCLWLGKEHNDRCKKCSKTGLCFWGNFLLFSITSLTIYK